MDGNERDWRAPGTDEPPPVKKRTLGDKPKPREPMRWRCRNRGCNKTSTNKGELCDPVPL